MMRTRHQTTAFLVRLAAIAFALALATGCQPGRNKAGFAIERTGSAFSPKGTPWTILCMERQGPGRQETIRRFAETLKRTPGIREEDVIIWDEPEHDVTRLYYGTYYRKTNPRTGSTDIPWGLRRDLRLIKDLGTPDGKPVFLLARKVRVPQRDVGKPEWELSRNASGKYSLQVAVFEPSDEFWEFKKAAAEYCELLRDKGYEAYYYHGDGASMVKWSRCNRMIC